MNNLYLYGNKLNFSLPTQKQLSLDFPSLKSWDAQTFSLKNLIMHTKLVKGMGFAWVFHPFLCGFKQKIGKNGDGDKKIAWGCIPLQAWGILGNVFENENIHMKQ